MEKVMERIERWKLLAKELKEEGKSVYIKDDEDNLYFCKIFLIEDHKIFVDCFDPEQRRGKREEIRWLKIIKFVEFDEGIRK